MGTRRRGHDQGLRARRLPHDRPRPGDRLREGQAARPSPSRASARATARTSSGSSPFRDLTTGKVHSAETFRKALAHVAVHVQRRLRGRPATSRCTRPASCRCATRGSTRGCPPRAPASTSGRASCRPPSTRSRSTRRAACWSTGTTARRPSWGAADDNWAYGSTQRVRMLTDGLGQAPAHDLASVTSAMNAAATQDLRSVALTPVLDQRCSTAAPAPSPRAARMLDAARRRGAPPAPPGWTATSTA